MVVFCRPPGFLQIAIGINFFLYLKYFHTVHIVHGYLIVMYKTLRNVFIYITTHTIEVEPSKG